MKELKIVTGDSSLAARRINEVRDTVYLTQRRRDAKDKKVIKGIYIYCPQNTAD